MYVGNVIHGTGHTAGTQVLLGLLVIPVVAALVFRILDEEKMLTQELSRYRDYTQQVQ